MANAEQEEAISIHIYGFDHLEARHIG